MIDEVKSLLETQNRDVQDFIKNAGGELKGIRSHIDERANKLQLQMDHLEAQMSRPIGLSDGSRRNEGKSLGAQLVESENFEAWRANGGVGKVRFKAGSILPETKTLTTTTAIGDATTTTLPGIVPLQQQRLRVRSLIPSRRVTSGSAMQYLRQLASTGVASPQIEASLKAHADLNFDLASVVYRTIAVWTSASRQVLDDLDELRNVIDRELMYLLESEVEEQLLAGDGVGQNLHGLITQATAYDTTRNVSGDNILDKVSHGLTQLEQADFMPNMIVLHPRDREKIRLLKDNSGGANTGQYVFGDPAARDGASVWSTPMAVTKSITQGTFLIGDSARGALVLDRQDATIDVSEHHDDYFAKNLIAIRCECRLALIVFRGNAFIYGSFS